MLRKFKVICAGIKMDKKVKDELDIQLKVGIHE